MQFRRPPIADRKLRFALAGCGRIAQSHFDAIAKHAQQAELVAVADTDPAALDAAVRRTGAKGFVSLAEMLAGSRPDCVVLDLMLPGRSGFDVCQAIKRTNPAAPVIMLTGIDARESRELARLVGADGYLAKPIDPARLIAEIRAAVQRGRGPQPNGHATHADRVMLQCRCGRRFRVSAAHRGRKLPCPTCGESLAVPPA